MSNNLPLGLNGKNRPRKESSLKIDLFGPAIHAATSTSFNKYEFVEGEGFDPFLQTFCKNSFLTVDIISPNKERIKYLLMSDFDCNYLIIELEKVKDDERVIIQNILSNSAIKVFKDGKSIIKALHFLGFSISQPYFDITLAGLVLDSGLGEVIDYESIVAKYALSIPPHDSHLNWNYNITKTHIKSVADNAAMMLELMVILKSKLATANLSRTASLEFTCLPAIVEMELVGIGIDEEKWTKLGENIYNEKNLLNNELKSILGNWDFDVDTQFLTALNNHGITALTISKESLSALSINNYPIIGTINNYLSAKTLIDRYFKNFAVHLSKHDNRLYPSYNQIRSTGRFYSTSPNIQQWPRRKDFRDCITAQKGNKLLNADYSQIELRIAADYTKDKLMVQAYQEGLDLHRLTASFILRKSFCEITYEERQAAKAVNFGLIYGMSASGLKKYARTNYNIEISELQSERFIQIFFQTYKGIETWHKKVSRSSLIETRTLLGRRKLWEKDKVKTTELYNAPIQGTSADITKLALSLLLNRIKHINGHIVAAIHDAIICEVPEEFATEGAEIVKSTMIEAGEFFIKSVPIEVEVAICDSWADK